MDLQRKAKIAAEAINSISRHDDEDAEVRKAFLQAVVSHIEAEVAGIDARVAARVAELAGQQQG